MDTSEADYLHDRLEAQIGWFSARADENQHAHKRLRLVEIIAAAAIPLFAGLSDRHWVFMALTSGLGFVVAVSAGIAGLYRFQENWSRYRQMAEALRREQVAYLARVGAYAGDGAFEALFARVEALLGEENAGWVEMVEKGQAQAATETRG